MAEVLERDPFRLGGHPTQAEELTRTIATAVTVVTTNINKAAQPISSRSGAKKVLAKAFTSDRARATRSQTPASGA